MKKRVLSMKRTPLTKLSFAKASANGCNGHSGGGGNGGGQGCSRGK